MSEEANIEWWKPFSLSVTAFLITFLLSIFLIVIMEALLLKSDKSDGIADVNDQSYIRYLWKFLPALAILAVRSLFEMISSSVRVVQPHHILRQGHAPKSVSWKTHNAHLQSGRSSTRCLNVGGCFFSRHLSCTRSTISANRYFGLYTTSSTAELQPISVTQLDFFNFILSKPFNSPCYNEPCYSFGDSPRNALGDIVPNMVLMFNLSYPQWTFEKYAMSKIEIPPNIEPTGASQLSVGLPAAYVDMNCSIVLSDQYQVVKSTTIIGWTLLFQNLGPENCHFSTDISFNFPIVDTTTPAEYWSLSVPALQQGPVQDGCPTWMFAFGKMDGEAISTAQASVVQCRPRIEAVNLSITLLVPSLQIDPGSITSPINSTRRTLLEGTLGSVVPTEMGQYLDLSPSIQGPSINFDGLSGPTLFTSMIQGLNGTAPEELATNAETLIEGIQRVYGLVIAQLLDLRARKAYPTNTTAALAARPTHSATLLIQGQERLKQSAVSTRITQALLATMAICLIATMVFMRGITDVVPGNPYTIAGTWSLLADSKMLEEDMVPLGAEWCDDTQLKERGVFEGRTFTPGWWEEKGRENGENEENEENSRDGESGENEENGRNGESGENEGNGESRESGEDGGSGENIRKWFGINIDKY